MDRFDQVYQLHRLLKDRRTPLSRTDLQHKLELKRSSTTRLITFCRNTLKMPIEFDRERDGYFYAQNERDTYELPGLWFNASELIALLTSHRLLTEVQPGILKPWLDPLQHRIEALLEHKRAGSKEIWQRIRILPMANRVPRLEDFQFCADALVSRKQLRILYRGRSNPKTSDLERWISPQRLVSRCLVP